MKLDRSISKLLSCAAIALALPFAVQAQNPVSYVATTGSDSNNCTSSAYCRTIAKALTVTNSGGEVVVEDSGNFGTTGITISQAVTISAVGVEASLDATSGDAVTVSAGTGNVTINGLNLRGHTTATNGVLADTVGILRLENVTIASFANDGVKFAAADGDLNVYSSNLNNNGNDGLILDASKSRAYIDGTGFDGNANAGADSGTGKLTINNSSAHYNGIGFYAHGGTVTLNNSRVVFNTTGLQVSPAGKLRFANCLVSDNTAAWNVAAGGLLSGSSPGTTLIAPGQTPNKGVIGAATTLQ
jgi:Right handed beta helix region